MRSYFWPTLLIVILWLLTIIILPSWVAIQFVPNLLLAGIVVLAVTDQGLRWYFLALITGFVLDVQNQLLIGSFFTAFALAYPIIHLLFKRVVPSHQIYFILPIIYYIVAVLCRVWVVGIGFLANSIGWYITPLISFSNSFSFLITTAIGSVAALIIYLFWLEILHRFDRPLRLRR